MKTKSLKNKLVVILSALMMFSAIFSLIGINGAKANGTALNEIVSDFTMGGGQAVRLAKEEGDPKGMRFVAHLSADDYDAINAAGYDSVEYGYFIMPEYYLQLGELDASTTFNGTTFTWNGKGDETGRKIIHNVGAEPVLDESGNYYLIRGSVVGMKEQNLATKYTGKMYIKATKGETVEYLFAENLENNYSMIDVAIMAMDTGVEDDSLQGYIDDYKAWYFEQNEVYPTYSYTVNYVAGDEIVDTQVVEEIDINTEINLTATAPEGYVLDAGKSAENKLTGKVYADNNLVLTVYVKADVALVGELYNGELYHFEKNAQEDAVITFEDAIGSVDSVKIGETVLDAENYSYDDETKALTINQAAVASLATGDVKMTISNANAIYTADVTVADVIVNSEAELYSAFEYISGAVANYCTDYIILGNDITCETVYAGSGVFRMGTFDGKGHVISNLNTCKFTSSLQSTSTFKNVMFLNVTNNGTSGFFGGDSGNYVFDNVAIIFNENNGGGLVNYSAGNITFKNSMIIDLNASSSATVGYISRTYNSAKTADFTNSCVITDKAPFQSGTDTTTDIYQSALAMRIATSAEAWFNSLNGVVPSYLSSEWSFDTNGNLCYNNHIVIKKTVNMVGTKNNGELFYFSKNVTDPTGYATAYVANDNYNVTLPTDVGTINSVSIAGSEITGFAYADNVLSIPVSAVASLANGTAAMIIDASTATYKATITITDIVLKTESDLQLIKTAGTNSLVLDGDIICTSTYGDRATVQFKGVFDGKGYAIKDIVFDASIGGLVYQAANATFKNLAMLNVTNTSGYRGGALTFEGASVTIDNVAVVVNKTGGHNGLVHYFGSGTNSVKNSIVWINQTLGSSSSIGALASTYGNNSTALTITVENVYAIINHGKLLGTENANATNVNYAAINELACANYAELKTASNNFANFDSNYWSVDASGNLCFGGNVVINA